MDYNNREEINPKYTWDLTNIYNNDEDWEKDYNKLKTQINKISDYNGKVMESPDSLYNTLEAYYDLETKISKCFIYASLKHDENVSNSNYSLKYNQAYSLYSEFLSLSSFIIPEILKETKTTINKFLRDKKLSKYKFLIEDIMRYKKHTLSSKEEIIISKLTSNNGVFDKLNSVLLNSTLNYGKLTIDNQEITITNSNYRNILTNKDRNIRKKCYELMTNKLKEYTDILGELLIASMKNYSNLASIKGYDSTKLMQLFSSNIPSEVVDNLYKVVHKRLDVFQKYLKFIKLNLGLESLEYYDLNAEYINNNITFTFDDVEDLVTEATKIYGKKYNDIIKKAFKERWIDYGSYKGKKSGAYCTATYGTHPVVLTNFHNKFSDVSAVAHELGHAVNFYLSIENNDAHNYQNDIFVAEVASLTNEIVLSNYIFSNTTNKILKQQAIANLIDIIQNNLFDACLEGELENEMYKLIDQKEEIDSNTLSESILKTRKEYYGNEIKLDDNIKYHWARRSHYFMPFYLFQYATGVSAAINIALNIINGDDSFKEKYLEFLSKGNTEYPIDLLKDMGIDMLKPSVINNAINYFDYLIDLYSKVSDE